jgi:hypothetical protein
MAKVLPRGFALRDRNALGEFNRLGAVKFLEIGEWER